MKIFNKKINERAITVLEYTLITAVVMIGIIIMGPTATNMVNGYLKSMEDSVQDSYFDPIEEDDGSDGPFVDGGCECEWQLPPPCTVEPCCGVGTCGPKQTSLVKVCDPPNCQAPEYQCTDHPECCVLTPEGCGALGICADEKMTTSKDCGDGDSTPTIVCLPDPTCQATCQGGGWSGATPCSALPGNPDPDDETGLTDNENYELVNSCTSDKCEWKCDDGYAKEETSPGVFGCTKLFVNMAPYIQDDTAPNECSDEIIVYCQSGYDIVGGGINTAGGDTDEGGDNPGPGYVAEKCSGSGTPPIELYTNEPIIDGSGSGWKFQTNHYLATGYARCGRLDLIPGNPPIVTRQANAPCDDLTTAFCDPGETLIGGGMFVEQISACSPSNNSDDKIYWFVSRPIGDIGWECGVDGRGGPPGNRVTCYAYCLQIPAFVP